jgi:Cupin domain
VLEGAVKITLGEREQICGRFDSTFIAAGVEHELVNVGEGTAFVLVVYGSPHVTRTFAEPGHTVEIGSDADQFGDRFLSTDATAASSSPSVADESRCPALTHA